MPFILFLGLSYLLTRSVAKVAYHPLSMFLNLNVEGSFDVVDMML